MEKTPRTKLQEQEQRVVTPTKDEATKKEARYFEGLAEAEHRERFLLAHLDDR